MSYKDLGVESVEGAQGKAPDLKVYGDGDAFALFSKASSQAQGWMKSTKVCNVPDGCIVQVTTQQRNPDGSYAVAEAVTYVPRVHMDHECYPPEFKEIKHNLSGLSFRNPTPEDEAKQKKQEEEYRYKEYLSLLLELHKSGHDVHKELNDTLKKVQSYMFE